MPWYPEFGHDQRGLADRRVRVLYRVYSVIQRKPLGKLQKLNIVHI